MSNLFFFSLASPGGMFSRQFGQYGVSTYWEKNIADLHSTKQYKFKSFMCSGKSDWPHGNKTIKRLRPTFSQNACPDSFLRGVAVAVNVTHDIKVKM